MTQDQDPKIFKLHLSKNGDDRSKSGSNRSGGSGFFQNEKQISKILSKFSKEARAELKNKVNEYNKSIIEESSKISKREKADVVSQTHIEQAHNNLISRQKSKWSYLLGTLGGILLGAVASCALGMLVQGVTYGVSGIVTIIVLGMIGVFLINNNKSK